MATSGLEFSIGTVNRGWTFDRINPLNNALALKTALGDLTANAFDYETGLLGPSLGRTFVSRLINSCALGVIKAAEPQYAGSKTGDPGLSSAMVGMKADGDVKNEGLVRFVATEPRSTTLARFAWRRALR